MTIKKTIKPKTKVTKKKTVKKKDKVGRKLFDGKDKKIVLAKLEQAFSLGCTDGEACGQADISVDALYRYERKNEKFRKRKVILKEKLILAARNTVAQTIQEKEIGENSKGVPTQRAGEMSKWYLERKKKNEFAPHSTVDTKIKTEELSEEKQKAIMERIKKWD